MSPATEAPDTATRKPWWLRQPARLFREGFLTLAGDPIVRHYARPFRVQGLENLDGIAGSVIFAAHHESHSDSQLVLAALPKRIRRRLVIAAAADVLFVNRVTGALAALFYGAVSIERKGSALASLRTAAALVTGGESLLIYPRGGCSPDGTAGEFKPGIGLLAKLTRAPVVLIAIRGSREALPLQARWPRRAAITLIFSSPITYAHASAEAFAAELQAEMVRLLGSSP